MNNLAIGVQYFVRVAARNVVSPQFVDPLQPTIDNTVWCSNVEGRPVDQRPSMVGTVSLTVSSRTQLQVMFAAPDRDGGRSITSYNLEYDTDMSFDSPHYVNVTVPADGLSTLYAAGPLVTYLQDLTPGSPYYVRVSAVNSLGASDPRYAFAPVAPMSAPDAPATVSLSAVQSSSTPITNLTVSWQAPAGESASGGSTIDGYLVEWWTAESIPEVQEIRLTWQDLNRSLAFKTRFGPRSDMTSSITTGVLPYNTRGYDLRYALMNIGPPENHDIDGDFVVGDVSVTRTSINNNKGYAWTVTFNDVDGLNPGKQVPLSAVLSNAEMAEYASVDVVRTTSGRRSHGNAEVQIVSTSGTGILPAGNRSTSPISGFFRVGLYGSALTQYLPADCGHELMEDALELLGAIGQVSVSRSENSLGGYDWRITFDTNVGDLPRMVADGAYLSTSNNDAQVMTYDGDTLIDPVSGIKLYDTVVGEAPARYHSRLLGPDDRSWVIPGLETGIEYYVRVSARNQFGTSPRAVTYPSALAPPKQAPGLPTDVQVAVNPGSSDSLAVTFSPPDSNGGDEIVRYRVELDPTETFDAPIQQDIDCPTKNLRTVFEITSHGRGDSPIDGYHMVNVGGNPVRSWSSFRLKLTVRGHTYYTGEIPYDAVAMQKDEMGSVVEIEGLKLSVQSGETLATITSGTGLLFQGDRIQIEGSANSSRVYTVDTVSAGMVNLTMPFTGTTSGNAKVSRVHGGRGQNTVSRVFCPDQSRIACEPDFGGSMQSKLEFLDEAITAGVNVIRTGPHADNGYTWRVTFLDDSPEDPGDFMLYEHTESLYGNITSKTTNTELSIRQLVNGKVHGACTGTHVVPAGGGLTTGTYYFTRVTAINSLGYSEAQVAVSPEKPMVPPGPPTSVSLLGVNEDSLRVVFSQPNDDGGDDVDRYLIMWATDPDFTDAQSEDFRQIEGGAPYFRTISGLTPGVPYYFKVFARNRQGLGVAQATTPPFLNPAQEPASPTSVSLAVTSDSMLTVSFDEPTSNGGDDIVSYLVEWDTTPNFNSAASAPFKGTALVDASRHRSHTIQLLAENTVFYAQVAAINRIGRGPFAVSNPSSRAPTKQVPGKPQTIAVQSGSQDGTIDVRWQYPRVPHHGIPCSGTPDQPEACPTPFGGVLAESTGGDLISEYEVEFNEVADFTGQDGGKMVTDGTTLTLAGLTSGRLYYIRVLARNTIGSGEFCDRSGVACPESGVRLSAIAA